MKEFKRKKRRHGLGTPFAVGALRNELLLCNIEYGVKNTAKNAYATIGPITILGAAIITVLKTTLEALLEIILILIPVYI
ncbi:MAG: hypothetical protein ABIV21_01860 [Pyrinomonadaceae bacterium]